MKRTVNHKQNIFKGMGYLIGYSVALVFAMLFYLLSKTFVIAIATYVSLGTTMGIVFEERFQNKQEQFNSKRTKTFMVLLFLGILVFISMFFIARHYSMTF